MRASRVRAMAVTETTCSWEIQVPGQSGHQTAERYSSCLEYTNLLVC